MDPREERIKQRAYEIWEQEGPPNGREQEHCDRGVQEIEAEGLETGRGMVKPDAADSAERSNASSPSNQFAPIAPVLTLRACDNRTANESRHWRD